MPFTNQMLVDDCIVLTVASGVIDYQLAIANQKRIAEHPNFDPVFDQIVDLTGVSKVEMTHEDLTQLSMNSPFLPTCRRAFIILNSVSQEKLGVFASLADMQTGNIYVTENREEAYRWLLDRP
jgi:hypothetical protein